MRRKTVRRNKAKFSRYTALVPKSISAVEKTKNTIINSIHSIFNKSLYTLKKGVRNLNSRTSKTIRSYTKKRS